jgi:hypothetical protein
LHVGLSVLHVSVLPVSLAFIRNELNHTGKAKPNILLSAEQNPGPDIKNGKVSVKG